MPFVVIVVSEPSPGAGWPQAILSLLARSFSAAKSRKLGIGSWLLDLSSDTEFFAEVALTAKKCTLTCHVLYLNEEPLFINP